MGAVSATRYPDTAVGALLPTGFCGLERPPAGRKADRFVMNQPDIKSITVQTLNISA